ncbi:MAG: hypothetical protein AAGG01_22580, partial [Planctomycetota bacterium]
MNQYSLCPGRLALITSLLAAPALAQPATQSAVFDLLASEDGPAVNGFSVRDFNHHRVTSSAETFFEVRTEDPDSGTDEFLFRNGQVVVSEGSSISALPGAVLGSVQSIQVNDAGLVARLSEFTDAGGASTNGLFFGGALVLKPGDATSAPELPAGTLYDRVTGVDLAPDGRVLLRCEVVSGGPRYAVLMGLEIGVDGTLLSESALLVEGDTLAGLSDPLQGFSVRREGVSLGAGGSMIVAGDTSGDPASDRFVLVNGAPVAIEGGASPVAGRSWGDLTAPEVHMNRGGDWVMKDALDGGFFTNDLIVVNGAEYLQEGETLPDIQPHVFERAGSGAFGTGPVRIDDAGRVLFLGYWTDAAGDLQSGIFFDRELMVRTGDVMDGLRINALFTGEGDYDLSANGQHLIFHAQVENAAGLFPEAVFLMSTALGEGYCVAQPNSSGREAATMASGSPLVATNEVNLRCVDMPIAAFGYFVTSRDRAFVPGVGGGQ